MTQAQTRPIVVLAHKGQQIVLTSPAAALVSTLNDQARWLLPVFIVLVSLTLVGAAIASEVINATPPCRLCYIQRFPHVVAALCALAALWLREQDVNFALILSVCGVSFLFSLALSSYHTGGELGFWDLSQSCVVQVFEHGHLVDASSLNSDIDISCDRSAWRLFGLPMAGYNALASAGMAAVTFAGLWLLWPRLDLAQTRD